MPRDLPPPRRVLITGTGWIVPEPLRDALAGKLLGPPEAAPEITGFEAPEGSPAFGFEALDFKLEEHCPNINTYVDRTSAMALAAAKLALADAGLLDREKRPQHYPIGCAYGTALGCLEAMGIFWKKVKSTNPKFAPPLPFTHSYANSPSSLLCIEHGLKGASATFSGERLAGVEALLFAFDQIATGSAEAIVVGASESLTRALHAHLYSEGRLSASGQLAAWSEDNDGVVPGEGGAFVVLESEPGVQARGHKAYAELAGVSVGSGGAVNPYLEAWDRAGEDIMRTLDLSAGPALVVAATPEEQSLDSWEGPFWAKRLAKAPTTAAIAPKLYTGELMSVSPVLGVALAAQVLAEKLQGAGLPQPKGLGDQFPASGPFVNALVGAIDPLASAGIVALRKS